MKYNILIVDDEPLVRRGIKTLVDLSEMNIEHVFEAENGSQGLKVFQENQIQIVLADINMPKMNGLEFSKAIKNQAPETKIALITGYDYFDYARTALKIGVDDYILKPVSKKDVKEIMLNLIHSYEKEMRYKKAGQFLDDKVEETDLSGYGKHIQAFIDSHIGDSDLSLTSLAEAMGLSQGYLSGLFKKLYGISFQDYIFKSRMEQAIILLLTTDMKNYQIAEAVGFLDANYFSSRFKKYTGKTPKQYRNEMVE